MRPNTALQAVDEQFETALAELETALEMPALPGEIPQWIAEVRKQVHAFENHLRSRLESRHERMYAEIEKEDPELFRRVEQMRTEDQALREAYGALTAEVHRFDQLGEKIEPAEAVAAWVNNLRESGTRLVIRIRTQELAIKTWLTEALTRDRGVVD